jgi:3-phosphoshikimate 1-carboxyvinyltransferase
MRYETLVMAPGGAVEGIVRLPGSKSVSNRALIIRALSDVDFPITGLSSATDTVILQRLLAAPTNTMDAGAGGTTFRFLLAFCAATGKDVLLTGSPRLCERPIAPLVEALRELGAVITYAEKEGFPPLQVHGSRLDGYEISIRADISSQFISALMLVAPVLHQGLNMHFQGGVVSAPYIDMTARVMEQFGVTAGFTRTGISVPAAKYSANSFAVPPDWSAAVFFYAMAALRPGSCLRLLRLAADRFQGDAVVMEWMREWGVGSTVEGDDIVIRSSGFDNTPLSMDFIRHPDLAQAFAVMAAVSGRPLELKGLSTLRNKETDRIAALQTSLTAAGVEVIEGVDSLSVSGKMDEQLVSKVLFPTYQDHRMVMALSLLSLSGAVVRLEDPQTVEKSYPGYFAELSALGFSIQA